MLYPSVIKNDPNVTIQERLIYLKEGFINLFKIFSNVSFLSLFIVQKLHF